MKLTIVLTVFNKEQFLRRALDSILSQETTNDFCYEVVAINDGSTDNSLAILNEYGARDSRLRVISQVNQGLSVARNNGVMEAKGDYVWFVDADDVISIKSVSLIYEATKSKPNVITIYAKYDGDNTILNCINPKAKTGKDALLSNWWQCGVFYILDRNFLIEKNLKFFPGIYHEDAEFTPRMLYVAKSLVVIPEILYTIFIDQNSITQQPRAKRAFDNLIVANHLDFFVRENKEERTAIGRVIDYNIAQCINNALEVIALNSKEDQKEFDNTFRMSTNLLRPLWRSPLKYRIEAFLFWLFSGHYVKIYKIMKCNTFKRT